jgi:hypothetical protein
MSAVNVTRDASRKRTTSDANPRQFVETLMARFSSSSASVDGDAWKASTVGAGEADSFSGVSERNRRMILTADRASQLSRHVLPASIEIEAPPKVKY